MIILNRYTIISVCIDQKPNDSGALKVAWIRFPDDQEGKLQNCDLQNVTMN